MRKVERERVIANKQERLNIYQAVITGTEPKSTATDYNSNRTGTDPKVDTSAFDQVFQSMESKLSRAQEILQRWMSL